MINYAILENSYRLPGRGMIASIFSGTIQRATNSSSTLIIFLRINFATPGIQNIVTAI